MTSEGRGILSPVRLPVPPLQHSLRTSSPKTSGRCSALLNLHKPLDSTSSDTSKHALTFEAVVCAQKQKRVFTIFDALCSNRSDHVVRTIKLSPIEQILN